MKNRFVKRIFSLTAALVMLFAMAVPAGATGNIVSLVPDLPPAISVNAGMRVTLEVAVSGDIPVEFQWCYADGTRIPNAPNTNDFTASYYQNTAVYCNVVCQTTVVRSNTCYVTVNGGSSSVLPQPDGGGTSGGTTGGTTSGGSTLVPPASGSLTAPIITRQPAGVVLGMGQAATLSVEATMNGYYPGVQLRYQWYKGGTNNATLAAPISGANSASYTTNPYDGSQYYLVAVWATDGTNTSTTTYSSMAAVSYGDMFRITKQPTGETVNVGGSALFIARADASVGHEWRLVSKDTTRTVPASQASYYFPGLGVSGEQTDTLALTNIPAELNDWSVECKFAGPDGSVLFTNGAIIKVKAPVASPSPVPGYVTTPAPTASPAASSYIPGSNALSAPSISSQPVGAVLAEGETVTLSVGATGADAAKGVELSYQWYRSEQNSNAKGTPISGATSETYVPDTISGSRYYYVAVTAKNAEGETKTTYSRPATVTYTAPISTPTPSPVATKAPVSTPIKNPGLGSMIIAPIIAIAAAAVAIGVGMFFLLKNVGSSKKKSGYERDYFDDDYYRDDEFDRR